MQDLLAPENCITRLFVTLQSWQEDQVKSEKKAASTQVDDETSKILNIR